MSSLKAGHSLGLLLAVVFLSARPAGAANVAVTLTDAPASTFAQQAGLDVAALRTQIEAEMNNLFQTYRVSDYLRSFGNAQSFATRGMGVDYGSAFDLFTLGFAGSLALNLDEGFRPENLKSDPAFSGASTNFTVMAGVSLSKFGLPLAFYGNYFSRETDIDEFTADLHNWGFHAQLRLFEPDSNGLLGVFLHWGGLHLTTGLEYAKTTMTLAGAWVRTLPVTAPAATMASVRISAVGGMAVESSTLSIPLEITTNLRLLSILSLYGGLGFDLQLGGKSELVANLNGTMTGVVPGQDPAPIGTAVVTATDAADPSTGRLRWLLGVQVNVLVVKLFAQLNLAAQDPVLASVALGARVAF